MADRSPAGNLWYGIVPAVALVSAFFVVPIGYTVLLSVQSPETGAWTFDNYRNFFSNTVFTSALLRTLWLSLTVVLLSSIIAFALTYFLVFIANPKRRVLWLLLLVAPFWTSFAIRAFSWQLVLADAGLITWTVEYLTGYLPQLKLLYTMGASVLGFTLFGTILISLLIFSVMITIDPRLIEASTDLGASRTRTFIEVILPLSLPGWCIGAVLTFIVCVGDYAVPTLLGGGFRPVLAQLMLSILKGTYDLPTAATFAVILVALVALATVPLLAAVRHVRFQS